MSCEVGRGPSLAAAVNPPIGSARDEPHDEQRADAQTHQVEEGRLGAKTQQQRRGYDQRSHTGQRELPPGPPPFLGALSAGVAHRLVGRPDGQADECLQVRYDRDVGAAPVWHRASMPLPSGRCRNASPSDVPP